MKVALGFVGTSWLPLESRDFSSVANSGLET